MLRAEKLTIGYDKSKPLISDINFACGSGEFILLLGINGIGKSTLLRTLCGLLAPLSGSMSYDGHDLSHMRPADRARVISGVFTGRDFDPFISVREFVALGRHPYTNWLGAHTSADDQIVESCLQKLGIKHMSDRKVQQLSDGERQKALIARALAQDTPVLILDEPTAFLDYKNKAELLGAVKSLARDHSKTILLSTHDISASLPYADRAFMVSESGCFVENSTQGRSEEELKMVMEGT